jgi:hypothetical protein
MGYTHYWQCNNKKSCHISTAKRKQILPIVQKIVTRYQAILTGDGSGETRKPVVMTPEMSEICFNGIEENSHETFFFPLNNKLEGFEFCKTARKPYDDPVMEILIVLKHFIPALAVSSDGFGTKACKFSEPGIAWVKAARRVRDLYGIVTKLFYWDGNPAPDTKTKPARKKMLVGAGASQDFIDPMESYRRFIRRP